MSLPQPDSVVTFGKRRGYVVGYVTLKRHGHLEEVRTFSIVRSRSRELLISGTEAR